jgi:predicted NBD/HSP70 family sugar kinase
MPETIGVDLGGTKIEGVALDAAGRPLHRVRVATERDRGYDHIVGRVADVVAALRPHAPDAAVVGIGTPGSLSAACRSESRTTRTASRSRRRCTARDEGTRSSSA